MAGHLTPRPSQGASLKVSGFLAWFSILVDLTGPRDDLTNINIYKIGLAVTDTAN